MSTKKDNADFYEDGAIGYIAKKITGKDKKDNKIPKTEKTMESFEREETSRDIIEIGEKLKSRSSESKVSTKSAIKISEISEEFKDIEVTNKKAKEDKNKMRANLLSDIKKSTEVKKVEEVKVQDDLEVSDIFKVNTKLQKLLSNGVFEENEDYIKMDEKFVTYVGIGSNASSVNGDLMLKLSTNNGIGNFSIDSIYQPVSKIESKKSLEKKKKQLYIEIETIRDRRGSHSVPLELTHSYEEVQGILEGLVSGDFKMYRYYNIIQLVDDDLEKLLERRDKLDTLMQTMDYSLVRFKHLQEPVHNLFGIGGNYDSFLELIIKDRLPSIYTVDSSLANVTNFITKEDNNVNGILIGSDIYNRRMIVRDLWAGDNYNEIIVGSSGSGKSYGAKVLSLREYNQGVRQIIIDPDAEFKDLTENIGGDYINIGGINDEQLNPFDFNFPKVLMKKHNTAEQSGVKYVVEHLDEFGPKIDAEFKEFLSRLKTLISIIIFNERLPQKLYSEISTLLVDFFIVEGKLDPQDYTSYFRIAKNPLSMKKFYAYLQKLIKDETFENREVASIIRKGLFDYADPNGAFSNILGEGENNVDIKGDWTVFNLKNIKNKGLKTVITFIIISFLEQIFAERQEQKTRILIDEASTLLGANLEIAQYIATLFQRARKYYMGITIIAQGIDNLYVDFKSSEKEVNFGDTFIQNAENMIILTQKPNALKIIQEKLSLTEMQFEFLRQLHLQKEHGHVQKGKALLMTGRAVDQIQILAEPYIHKYINTDPSSK